MSEEICEYELIPLSDPRYRPERSGQFLVAEMLHHEPVYPSKVRRWDRLVRRCPSPSEITAMWEVVERTRREQDGCIGCVIAAVLNEQPIRGVTDVFEALVTVDGSPIPHPGIGIEWPYRTWWLRRLAGA